MCPAKMSVEFDLDSLIDGFKGFDNEAHERVFIVALSFVMVDLFLLKLKFVFRLIPI